LIAVIAVVAYFAIWYSNVVLFMAALIYMFSGIWARAAYGWSRRRRRRPTGEPAAEPDPEPDPAGPRFSD
jgi:CDP-diacylglycerol--serine O-phosphatidyltransferase